MTENQEQIEAGGIIRVVKDSRYFVASNEPFNDKIISWETRGLLGYLFSKPDKWQIKMKDLLRQGPAGEHKLRRMLAEARERGYITLVRITKKDGTFDWVTAVYESPKLNPHLGEKGFIKIDSSMRFSPTGQTTSRRLSTSGSSTRGKPPSILNTEGENTDEKIEITPKDKILSMSAKEAGKTPQIKAFEDVTGFFPGLYQWVVIIQTLETTGIDKKKLAACWNEWANGRGYNPKSLNWLIDWYINGIPTRSNGSNGNGLYKQNKGVSGEEAAKILRGES
jgi:hypothetical protein